MEETKKESPEKQDAKKKSSYSIHNIKSAKAVIQGVNGKVTFGKGCIVHPNAQIIAEGGDIIIQDFNIIEEKVIIYNRLLKDKSGNIVNKAMKIGNFNHFEAGAILESSDVGNYNVFQNKCHVEINCKIQDGCTIGVYVKVPVKSVIENMMAISFPGHIVQNTNFNIDSHKFKIISLYELLSNLIPKYNNLQN